MDEENYINYLTFAGSVFIGKPEGIEVYSRSLNMKIPHFKPKVELIPLEIKIVSFEVDQFLRKSDFFATEYEENTSVSSSRKQYTYNYFMVPVRYNPESDSYEKLVSFKIVYNYVFDPELKYGSTHNYADNSVLTSGDWYKICLDDTGIYKLGYNQLLDLGINPGQINKTSIAIYGNGGELLPEANDLPRPDDLIENDIYVSGTTGSFGENDYILFYGQSPHKWHYDSLEEIFNHQVHYYSDKNCYFLTTNKTTGGNRITTRSSLSGQPSHQVAKFQDYVYHQRDLYNLIESGRIWYGEIFDATLERQFDFTFPDLDPASMVTVKANIAARSSVVSSFLLNVGNNNTKISIPAIDQTAINSFYARDGSGLLEFFPSANNNISVELKYNRTATGGRGWLNYIAVNATRNLIFRGTQMSFRNVYNIGQGNISEYLINNVNSQLLIWDVTDPFNIRNQSYQVSGTTASFKVETNELKEFIAFDGTSYKTPKLIGKINNQNLHGLLVKDMVIIAPEMFIPEAQRLADFRLENDGITSVIVTPEQIYNEFSSGIQDIGAIRNFMKMFYDRAETDNFPQYLLLFGNGTYDNKNILGYGGNLIPTFQTYNSLHRAGSWMTDDFYGLLDDNEGLGAAGLPDIGIGRFPVRTAQQAKNIVDKVIRYDARIEGWEPGSDDLQWVGMTSNYADWRKMITLIADDQDNNTHFTDSEKLAAIFAEDYRVYNIEKIYLDAYEQVTMAGGSRYPEVNKSINNRVNQGALLINYLGHGGRLGLAHERVVTFDDINTWNNYYNMPVFLTATCEFSAFDLPSPDDLSAGVRIFLRNSGGAIALFTTTRLAWSGSNYTLNERFVNNAFKPMENGEMPRLGDLQRLSKTASDNVKNFVLLGDPSMRMAYPKYTVITEEMPDTLKAFQKVEISGYIIDETGNIAENYNGVVFPKVYDKRYSLSTLGNDPDSYIEEFFVQNSLIYKGKASIVNGRFEFSFVVPKDITYTYGNGKISYYADNGIIDAKGFHEDFIIGGSLTNIMPDNSGPEIVLYMNDTSFVSGDETDSNPILLAFLYDENGINVTGKIGHDLIAFLNNDRSGSLVLNNYYEADLDTYKSGKIVFPFYNISEGKHTVAVRAWDVFNNFSEESIDFVVGKSAQLALYDILNYPNPFNIGTSFEFKHNIPTDELDVYIDIYNINGQLAKSIKTSLVSFGNQSLSIDWDGNDNSGRPINSGVYIYRILVKTQDGKEVLGSSRFVIIR